MYILPQRTMRSIAIKIYCQRLIHMVGTDTVSKHLTTCLPNHTRYFYSSHYSLTCFSSSSFPDDWKCASVTPETALKPVTIG